jgi:tetratricopeptide (TPR) repeat protein
VRLVPDFADAYSNLAVVHRRQGHLDRALDTYILALGVDPGSASIRNNLLVLYSMLVGERRATSEAEQLLLEGDQELTLGRVSPALEFYRRATRLDPASAPAHVAAARALLVKGQMRKALKSLHLALEADPENADALRLTTGLDRLAKR